MLKKIPLRIRFALMASLFLLISCVTLTLLSNASAGQMMEAIVVVPAEGENAVPMMPLEPASAPNEQYFRIFRQKTAAATVVIVLVGSIAAYFAAGYVLKPIRLLSSEVQKRNAENLGEPIAIPQSADEIRELTLSFNQMMADLRRAFLLQKEFSANAAHELRTPLAVMRAKLDVFHLEGEGDPETRLLERVFYNLLENAVKYSPPHTRVEVTTEKKNGTVQVRVADQGEGIPEEYREAVFEPFFRVDKSRSRAVGGSGLGLAVCKKILERHHAGICILPNQPSGSIFQITFPS